MLRSPICLDASFVVRLATGIDDDAVRVVWDSWNQERREYIAPVLIRYEITNALFRYVRAGRLTAEEATLTLRYALSLPIQLTSDEHAHERAFGIAARFSLPAAYDAHYLDLSEHLGLEFWTADKRLANAVGHALPWVHLVES